LTFREIGKGRAKCVPAEALKVDIDSSRELFKTVLGKSRKKRKFFKEWRERKPLSNCLRRKT